MSKISRRFKLELCNLMTLSRVEMYPFLYGTNKHKKFLLKAGNFTEGSSSDNEDSSDDILNNDLLNNDFSSRGSSASSVVVVWWP